MLPNSAVSESHRISSTSADDLERPRHVVERLTVDAATCRHADDVKHQAASRLPAFQSALHNAANWDRLWRPLIIDCTLDNAILPDCWEELVYVSRFSVSQKQSYCRTQSYQSLQNVRRHHPTDVHLRFCKNDINLCLSHAVCAICTSVCRDSCNGKVSMS